ncbi:hypothetical protein AVEN_70389-1 [Araneus ventricosus]|uniref:Uncharacterized protein n=1 Tax=Araneus ventricosus TaxID=182803 RepID=A0A4Y2B9M8_ARAVE|nr:hypothetical protein AVEN_70389-1 [Araneus ventricosus]
MYCRSPAWLVLWLGREFYRGEYGMPAAPRIGLLTLTTILEILRKIWCLWRKNKDSRECVNFLGIATRNRDPDFSRDCHGTSRPVRNTMKIRG